MPRNAWEKIISKQAPVTEDESEIMSKKRNIARWVLGFAIIAGYILAILLIPKLPRSFTESIEGKSATVSLVTTFFSLLAAIWIATGIFGAVKRFSKELYSRIDHLKQERPVLDDEKMESLGLRLTAMTASSATMRYPAGCIMRERERLARIFAEEKSPEKIAQAILDNSLDDKVFKWNGPEVSLDVPPKSVSEREKEKNNGNT